MKWQRRFSTPESKRQYVRQLFARIADRYDLITILLSGGLDRRWKARLVRGAVDGSAPRLDVLDLACGTGDIALAAARRGAHVVGLDITPRMLALAQQKHLREAPHAAVRWVAGDMAALPFADATFDVITTGYGLRNVPHLPTALSEMARVLRPGGRVLSLDFDRPQSPLVRAVYFAYLTTVGSVLGLLLHGDPDTYRYIPQSISRYPGARGVAALVTAAGFRACTHEPVLGGLMAIHRATK